MRGDGHVESSETAFVSVGRKRDARRMAFSAVAHQASALVRGRDRRGRLLLRADAFRGRGRLIIGEGSWIGPYTLISAHGASGMVPTLSIGKNCMIAHMCSIKTGTHEIDVNAPSVVGRNVAYDIAIGEGSWICASVTIIPGVTVGKKCICAAGAVVIRDVPDYTLVAGVPAVAKRNLRVEDC